jgi:signal transduction histidine kinase
VRQKSRLLAAILLVALAAVGIFYYATSSVISHAFDTIETAEVNQNTDRAVEALNSSINQLVFKVTDWSSWDDTYAFVENRNKAYINSNLQPSALSDIGIDTMLFFNQRGQLVFDEAVDPTSGNQVPVPTSLLQNFAPTSKLLASSDTSASQGLITLPTGTVEFVSEPILTSESTGPEHGTIVFGIWLTPSQISQFSALTKLNVNYYRLNDPSLPQALKKSLGTRPVPNEKTIVRLSSTQIIGYEVMPDVYGKAALVAKVQEVRDIHEVAMSALKRFLLLVLLDTIAAVAICLLLLETIRRRDRTIALKNEFFSIASHELRTPLTVIRDYAQLMKFQFSRQINDPKFDHMVDNIDTTGAQLIGLVNVFLDAARMEQGKIPFEVKPFSINPLLVGIQPEITATARKKGITFTVDTPPDLPLAMGDEARVRQIILNIIGNAMKFTDTGGITLKAEVKGKMLMVYVSDTGRGMDQAAQKVLFQRFSQVKTGDAKLGSGLGLFISKKLIEQMGGSIQVESSAPGIGTSISFSLPLPPPNAETPAAPPSASGPQVLPPETPLPAVPPVVDTPPAP